VDHPQPRLHCPAGFLLQRTWSCLKSRHVASQCPSKFQPLALSFIRLTPPAGRRYKSTPVFVLLTTSSKIAASPYLRHGVSGIAVSMNGPIDSSKLSSTETPESLHSCQLCPLIKLEAGVVSTITLPFNQVFLSARDGCRFLIERVYRIVPPSSWMFKDDPGPLLYLYLFGTKIASEISLEITTSLIDGCCIVDCDWRMSDAPWDDCIEDKLLAYTKRGRSLCHPSRHPRC